MAAAERRALAACAIAFAALAGSPAFAADDLGTLFTTADARERLDRLRRGEPLAPSASTAEEPARPSEVTGFVRRSDGRNTVWIDGVPTVTRSPKAAPLLEPGSVRGSSDAPGLHVETRPAR